MEKKRKLGGGLLLLAGGFFGRETGAYIWEGLLNVATAGATKVSWSNFPWLNALGFLSFVAGIIVLIWPWFKSLSGRMTLSEERVISLINNKIAALPVPAGVIADTSHFQDTAMREIEALAAIQKTAIEENKVTHQLCSSLKSEVAALAARGFSLPADILEDIQKGVTALERIEHAKRLKQAKSALDQCEKRHLATPENNTSIRKDSLNALILGSIQESATMIGIDQDYIKQKMEEIKKGVEADAQFLEFTGDDKKTWLDKFEKRNFIIQSKQRDELLNMIRKVATDG